MTTNSYIPGRDGDFNAFSNALDTTLAADPAKYGLTAEDITELQDKLNQWNNRYSQMVQAKDNAKASVVGKANSRKELTAVIRDLVRQIQADPSVSDEAIADAGLPVHSTSRNFEARS